MDSVDASSGLLGRAVVGFFLGAFVGSAIGIAAFGTAISGTVPIGILGAWLGYRHRKPIGFHGLDLGKPNCALRYLKQALLLAVDLLVLFLLFIRKACGSRINKLRRVRLNQRTIPFQPAPFLDTTRWPTTP
jgi:hypothetical protein